ncbi:protein of unknown function [Monaibacterium marinum]|uniref:DUF350 domain-containing protein n=1 Tax=Pontivivens marinum TaxID=1690039 RepID=A0A2C9CSE7_9RHOB|nr:DUF350 domain-containing protein [Monaibacterium marinum]SOH93299.1 protein of unknown function [Monaibacterium marinum]
MDLFSAIELAEVVSTVFYTFMGMILMFGAWKFLDWITPFPIMKEIEEDQNVALAIVIGLLFVAMAIIIAAVILS